MNTLVITGCHFTPAEALQEQLPEDWRAVWLADPAAPKFRRYDWPGSLGNLVRLPGLISRAAARLKQVRPAIVVSFGGYSSVPVCLAAKWLGLPLLVHEQTFGAGLAARITGIIANKVAISWPSSRRYFSASKTVLTGNPIRQKIAAASRSPRPVIYVSGGSQGSLAINEALRPVLPELLGRFTVCHAYGRQSPLTKHPKYLAKPYFDSEELAKIYSRSRLVIGRSGINTVTELGYLGIPAVLIPLPYTQKGEQAANAAYLASLGLAVVLPQTGLTPVTLLAAVNRCAGLKAGASRFPKQLVAGAAAKLWQLCLELS